MILGRHSPISVTRLSSITYQLPTLNLLILLLLPDIVHIKTVAFLFLRWVCSICQVIQIIPVWRTLTVNIVVPVTDTEFLVEAGLIATHVGNPPSILITHVENHAIKLKVSIEPDWSVCAVEGESNIWELCPPLFL